ncbi:MAG: outer membrane lipoprotein carrier protein LolA [Bacteroidaceae bacterium]|nr:outer membrane lipoprotein carrier protein LolA [Bacteroidaceae bacterium]
MKKTFLSTILLLAVTLLYAQHDVRTAEIEKMNAAYTSFQCQFTQEDVAAGTGKKEQLSGTLYFQRPDRMAMHYTQPESDLLVINGDLFYMKRGKRDRRFNTAKNARMRSLSSTLLACMMGNVAEVAATNGADIEVDEKGGNYVVILSARKKQPRGYSRIVLEYRKSDGLLQQMQMDEFGGKTSLYTLASHQTNAPIQESLFMVKK